MTTAPSTPLPAPQPLQGFRLSPQQQHLWTLQQQNSTYACQMVWRWTGSLQSDRLQRALQQVIDRYDILRTSFPRRPGTKLPLQAIAATVPPTWKECDWSELPQAEQIARQQACLQAEQQQLVEGGQSLRAVRASLSERESWLILTLSGLCGDRLSLQLLSRAIASAYELDGRAIEEDKDPVQYLQVSEWQNELLATEEDDYWPKQSAPTPPFPLPLERSATPTFVPSALVEQLSAETVTRLTVLARQQEVEVADVLLACWQVLLWKLTGETEGKLHLLADGRDEEELASVIGPLAKWLPLRYPLQPSYRFAEVLAQSQSSSTTAKEYRDSFGYASDKNEAATHGEGIGFEWASSSAPIRNGSTALALERQRVYSHRLKLALTCLHSDRGLTLEFHYDTQRLLLSDIQRLKQQFLALVEDALAHPDRPIDRLEILDDRDRHQLLQAFNQTEQSFAAIDGLHTLFEAQVEQYPDRVAVAGGGQQLTYSQLNPKANQLARHLQSLGVGPETIVGISLLRSPNAIVALLAVLKAGGAYLPLDPTLPVEAAAQRLQDAKAIALISQTRLAARVPDSVSAVVYIDGSDANTIATYPDDNLPCQNCATNLAYALYTSGSTGTPKGVAIEHRQMLNYLQAISTQLDLPAAAHFALVSTLAADLGNTVLFPALTSGGCLHVIPEAQVADAAALTAYFQQHPIDCLKIVPSHLAALLLSGTPEALLPKRQLVLGGESLSRDLLEVLQSNHCAVLNHYGPTETTVGVLTHATSSADTRDTVPLGRPLANCRAYVLDSQLRPVPIGVVGDLYIGGAQVARGYLNRPSLTAERFLPDPFSREEGARLYKTGDRARYLADGKLEFVGRSDRQVKLRGYRIELGEIEAALVQHPAIQQAAVTVWTKSATDRRLAAYFVAAKGQASPSTSDLRDFLRQKLPPFMRPSSFTLLKTLPLTANGKVDWKALPDPDFNRPDLEATYVPPRTEAERQIASLWQEILGLETVGIQDNFFDLGGHSLSVIAMHAKLRELFDRNIAITDLFQYTTVSALAAHLTQTQTQSTAADRSRDRAASRLASRQRRPSRMR
ncbi:non-ribosomal peptide synthetase [Synechococcus sp. PCC 7336]|uniref:non-ribosomal peptide synthetase n=1 Tax=Synechococcus sp. PCC 7336 TaxID=195250 RepID=UPI00034C7E9C|nr:non-ribosomal peptide synthetase [Synechococcus sp. PCC 7336]